MDTELMNTVQADYSIGQDRSWEKEVNLLAPGISKWILLPEKIISNSVTVSFTGGGSGYMQTSTDPVYVIKTGSPTPVNWPFGTVSTTQTRVCKPCSAMRAVQVGSGTMKVTMRTS